MLVIILGANYLGQLRQEDGLEFEVGLDYIYSQPEENKEKKRDEGRKGEEGWGREKGGWKKLRREWGQ